MPKLSVKWLVPIIRLRLNKVRFSDYAIVSDPGRQGHQFAKGQVS